MVNMNWLIIALDILFALVAAVLGILGQGTFKTILFGSIYNYSRKVKTTIKATAPAGKREAELTGLRKQTADLLKQVEKLKAQHQ